MNDDRQLARILLVLVALLLGLVVGQVGGILAMLGGATVAPAFVAGAIAFGSTVALALAIEKALGLL